MSTERPIIIGTRGSKLALWQSNHVADILRRETGREVELNIIKTTGDIILDVPLAKIGDKGLFVKEIETALLDGDADIAVHSMKDMPTELPEGLAIGAALIREKPLDVVIMRAEEGAGGSGGSVGATGDGSGDGPHDALPGDELLKSLPAGARVGTSSLRRRSQILKMRTDLDIQDVRGNLDTRIAKLDAGEYDAILLAGAGVRRLGWGDRITAEIPADAIMPAVGQGAICVEYASANDGARALCDILNHSATHVAVRAERALMRKLEGGCQVPIGALAVLTDAGLFMRAVIASLDGQTVLHTSGSGSADDPEALGRRLADELVEKGAGAILEEIRAL